MWNRNLPPGQHFSFLKKATIFLYISFVNKASAEIPPFPLLKKGSCEKIDLVLFYVIPAKAGIQCFQGLTNLLDPGFHRGDGRNPISSQLQGGGGGI
jgi:hypothetical protein